jgi:hypothetical protein
LAGEREVKAQIKLCFKTMNGKMVTVVRNMQLTQRANGKQEYKFVDGSTKMKDEKGVPNHKKFMNLLFITILNFHIQFATREREREDHFLPHSLSAVVVVVLLFCCSCSCCSANCKSEFSLCTFG